MICSKCNKEITDLEANYCSSCGNPVGIFSEVAISSEIKIGDSSIGVGIGAGNKVEIGQFIATVEKKEPPDNIKFNNTIKGKPIERRKVRLFKNLSLLIGFVGTVFSLIGSVNSLLGVVNNSGINQIWSVITPVSVILFLVGILAHVAYVDLMDRGFIWLKPHDLINIKLKLDEQDKISRLSLKGTCIVCGGDVYLSKDSEGKILGYCRKNPAHKYSFDHTNFTGKLLKD